MLPLELRWKTRIRPGSDFNSTANSLTAVESMKMAKATGAAAEREAPERKSIYPSVVEGTVRDEAGKALVAATIAVIGNTISPLDQIKASDVMAPPRASKVTPLTPHSCQR